jgi:hypothetical protein
LILSGVLAIHFYFKMIVWADIGILFNIFSILSFPRIEFIKINQLIYAHKLTFYPIVAAQSAMKSYWEINFSERPSPSRPFYWYNKLSYLPHIGLWKKFLKPRTEVYFSKIKINRTEPNRNNSTRLVSAADTYKLTYENWEK